jgi:hypothetical protein
LAGQASEISGDWVGVEVEVGTGLGVLFGKTVGEAGGRGLLVLVGVTGSAPVTDIK